MEAHLSALGVPRSTFAPPLYRMLWETGIEATPPLFAGFVSLALLHGVIFALLWGAMMSVFFSTAHYLQPALFFAVPDTFIVVASLLCGAVFGVVGAGLVRYKARQLELPLWSDYAGSR